MRKPSLGLKLLAFLAAAIISITTSAAIVQQMTLGGLVNNADKVFRGTVINKEPGTIMAGGSELPTVIYTLRVEESLKGDFGVGKKSKAITLTMLGSLKNSASQANVKRFAAINMNPDLKMGSDYILFTTTPSSLGLMTTVGLDQGLFKIFSNANGSEMVSNGLGNQGLFSGLVSYSELKSAITKELN